MMTALVVTGAAYVLHLVLRGMLAAGHARKVGGKKGVELAAGSMTIAQPILSGDPLLEECLEANLRALPDQVFLWLVDEDDAEGRRVAEKLQQAHPDVDVRIDRCPACGDTTNPKLWKLRRAAALVDTAFFCVLDDDTILSRESAAALVAGAKDHTVATGLPYYRDAGDLSSRLLSQFVNNNSIFTYLGTSRVMAPFTLNGMGYVMKSGELAGLRNFEPVLNELTDDLALATLVLGNGGDIHQSTATLRVQTGVRDLGRYMQMMHRWYLFVLLLMRRQGPACQGVIFFLHGLPSLLFIAFTVMSVADWSVCSAMVWLVVILLRSGLIVAMQHRFTADGLHRPGISILSELMQPVHLFHAICNRTIRWRTRRYRVRDSNDFTAV